MYAYRLVQEDVPLVTQICFRDCRLGAAVRPRFPFRLQAVAARLFWVALPCGFEIAAKATFPCLHVPGFVLAALQCGLEIAASTAIQCLRFLLDLRTRASTLLGWELVCDACGAMGIPLKQSCGNHKLVLSGGGVCMVPFVNTTELRA